MLEREKSDVLRSCTVSSSAIVQSLLYPFFPLPLSDRPIATLPLLSLSAIVQSLYFSVSLFIYLSDSQR